MTRLTTYISTKNQNRFSAMLLQPNRGNQRQLKGKVVSRARFRVASTMAIVQETILFYKIYNKQAPGYLIKLIPTRNEAYQTKYLANIPSLSFKLNFFKNTFPHQLSQNGTNQIPAFEIELAIMFLKIEFQNL